MDFKQIHKEDSMNHNPEINPESNSNNELYTDEDSICEEDISRLIADNNDSGHGSSESSDSSGNKSEFGILDFTSCDDYEAYEFLESAFDPLSIIPPERHDLMLQHLPGKELLSACEVSLNWSQKLSKSPNFMSKVILRADLTNRISGEENLLAVVKSRRAYQHLNISLDNDKEVEKIVDWTLKKFASSLVSLKILKIGRFQSLMNLTMPTLNMESFELHVVCGTLFCGLEKATKLKKLVVKGLSPDALESCLQRNPCLKELTLYENSFITYFGEDISLNTSFKLKKLAILDHRRTENGLDRELQASDWDGQQRDNFIKLLKSQARHLKYLSLDTCHAEDLNVIITCLPKLKYLELNNVTGDLDSLTDLNNISIRTFVARKVSYELIEIISKSFLNLKVVYIERLDTNQFFTIIKNARRLKQLRYFWATASEKKDDAFVDLKTYYIPAEMCKSLKVRIRVGKKDVFLKKVQK